MGQVNLAHFRMWWLIHRFVSKIATMVTWPPAPIPHALRQGRGLSKLCPKHNKNCFCSKQLPPSYKWCCVSSQDPLEFLSQEILQFQCFQFFIWPEHFAKYQTNFQTKSDQVKKIWLKFPKEIITHETGLVTCSSKKLRFITLIKGYIQTPFYFWGLSKTFTTMADCYVVFHDKHG